MEETKITISLGEYTELIKAAEKIAAVERLLGTVNFLPAVEVAALLGIKTKEKEIPEYVLD